MRKALSLMVLSALYAATAVADNAKLTYYWITFESDESGSGPKDTKLQTCSGQTIASVTYHYADRVRMEGTGKLNDGRVVNIGGCDCGSGFRCFDVYDPRKYPWGIGSANNAIYPFSSVANNDYKVGTKLYVKAFDGFKLPGGQRHNGCFEVGDKGWGLGHNHIDFFAGREKYYHSIANVLNRDTVDYQVSNCQVQRYQVSFPAPSV